MQQWIIICRNYIVFKSNFVYQSQHRLCITPIAQLSAFARLVKDKTIYFRITISIIKTHTYLEGSKQQILGKFLISIDLLQPLKSSPFSAFARCLTSASKTSWQRSWCYFTSSSTYITLIRNSLFLCNKLSATSFTYF